MPLRGPPGRLQANSLRIASRSAALIPALGPASARRRRVRLDDDDTPKEAEAARVEKVKTSTTEQLHELIDRRGGELEFLIKVPDLTSWPSGREDHHQH
jgi:hypothetical protein